MKQVSEEWGKAIYSQTRETKAVIKFPFVDPEAKSSAEFEISPPESIISKIDQTIDENTSSVGKVAGFEPEYWKLDGSFVLPAVGTKSQYGFRSYNLSDYTGEFSSDNVLRFYFTQPITVPGYTLSFDEESGEFLTDFDIISYDENLSVIRKIEVRNNENPRCVVEYGSENVKYVDLVFLRTNNPHRSVRLIEIDFGILLVFEGKNLYQVQLTSETDYLAESVPRNELVFSAFNDGKYDYTNSESYSKYLQERQEVEYYHRVKLEDDSWEEVPMGKYLLYGWKVSDQKVEFNLRDDSDILDDKMYELNSLEEGISAGKFFERIFGQCGITDFVIPEYLYSSPNITPYVGENCLCREALRKVASLCGCAIFITTSGTIVIHKVEFKNSSQEIIDYEAMFSAPNSSSTKYYNAIQLTVYTKEGENFQSTLETYTAPWYQSGETIYPYKLDLNMCINDERWENLKPWVLEQKFRVLGFRLYADIEWRQNPAHEIGDYVSVQLDKSGGESEVFMQKQIITYNGGVLRGTSVGIGKGRV